MQDCQIRGIKRANQASRMLQVSASRTVRVTAKLMILYEMKDAVDERPMISSIDAECVKGLRRSTVENIVPLECREQIIGVESWLQYLRLVMIAREVGLPTHVAEVACGSFENMFKSWQRRSW
jgi:hypothetical protein